MALDGAMKLSDRIRAYVDRTYVQPARQNGREVITIRAGDVHTAMGWTRRQPLVCSVLRSRKLQRELGVELIRHTGPYAGANAYYEFRILGSGTSPGGREPPKAPTPVTLDRHALRTLPTVTGNTVILVACVASKRSTLAPARALYLSPWFRKARAVAEQVGVPWFILSAKYGLVHPDGVIAPYEKTLNAMPVTERRVWAESVHEQLTAAAPGLERVIVLAGARYREILIERLRAQGVTVEVPMAGLRFREQLSWLKQRADHG